MYREEARRLVEPVLRSETTECTGKKPGGSQSRFCEAKLLSNFGDFTGLISNYFATLPRQGDFLIGDM